MDENTLMIAGIVLLAILIYLLITRKEEKKEAKGAAMLEDLAELGEVFPDSIHPKIDMDRCIGSGACVRACPEKNVITIVNEVVHLTNPLGCIGHGACESACPVEAITLVFGNAKRGVELPKIDPDFQTTREGVYIIGELGGMGLIRNAVMQGSQAADHIIDGERRGVGEALDAIVVGCGPAGISATLRLAEKGLKVMAIDREKFGGTIMHYPRAKVVMTGVLDLPAYGKVRKRKMSKEQLVELWGDIRKKTDVPIVEGELVEGIDELPDGMWAVRSEGGTVRHTANVLLGLGRRGSPRKLGVKGENRPKVHYRLLEPAEFADKDVLVVGGGNSAVESALALADQGGCRSVSISYRRQAFGRCRGDNKDLIAKYINEGRVRALLNTNVAEIHEDKVIIKDENDELITVPNDSVIVQAGGTPPGKILGDFGVEVEMKYGERR